MRGCQMSLVTGIQAGLVGMGALCLVAGARLDIPTLLQAGMGSIGLGLMVIGGEAMVTRRIVRGREGGTLVAYGGWAAVFYGIVLMWIGMALIGARLIGPALGLDRLPQLSLSTLLYLVLFFLLGFFLFASLFAALGAAAQDEQNLGQLSWPAIFVLVFPMVSAGPIITAPGSSFAVFLSLFPLTAPIVMFVRILVSDPKTWQILLSVGIQVAAIGTMILLSAKIFRIGILMTGKRFTLAEVFRLLRA